VPINAETSKTYNKSIFESWVSWRGMRSALRLGTTGYAHENKMLGGFEVVRHSAKLVAVSKMREEEATRRPQGDLAVCIFV